MLNKCTLIGNVGKDPEIKNFEHGKVAKFSLATVEYWRDKKGEVQSKTTWHNIICWKYLAEKAETKVKKGMTLAITGKITNRSWEKSGTTHYVTEIVANSLLIVNDRGLNKAKEPARNTEYKEDFPQNEKPKPEDDLPF